MAFRRMQQNVVTSNDLRESISPVIDHVVRSLLIEVVKLQCTVVVVTSTGVTLVDILQSTPAASSIQQIVDPLVGEASEKFSSLSILVHRLQFFLFFLASLFFFQFISC